MAQEFLEAWSPDDLFHGQFGEFKFPGLSEGNPTIPRIFTNTNTESASLEAANVDDSAEEGETACPTLRTFAAATVMSLPWRQKIAAVNQMCLKNQGLADVILSVNRIGYGPVAEFVRHVALCNGEEAAAEDGMGDAGEGQVTLASVHSSKGA
jgi:superfamily I DNA/RNA helicase